MGVFLGECAWCSSVGTGTVSDGSRVGVVYNPCRMASRTGIVLLTALGCGAATALGAAPGGLIGVTSDYVLRGVSQSDGDPAAQGEVHLGFARGWSTGLWASQIRLLPGHTTAEIDLYLQWHATLSDSFDMSATATHYSYPGDPRPIGYA